MRFDDDKYYRTNDPALELIAKRGTLAQWRCQNRGPKFFRHGRRILYRGADLNAWLDAHTVHPGYGSEP